MDVTAGGSSDESQVIMTPGGTEQDAVKGLKIDAHSNLSLAYLKLLKFEKAEASARQALELDPSNSKATYRLGLALLGQEKVEESREFVLKAAHLDPQNRGIRATLEEIKGKMKEVTKKAGEAFAGKML
jgi:tetratricopeptide (TPR) repeat protein